MNNELKCTIAEHVPTEHGEGCICGYFIQRKIHTDIIDSMVNSVKDLQELNKPSHE